ncbi:threonine aldolase family protein [Aquamicrobium ahrensii]|uniref:Threonine aldolase n=1 Tax=Aquamicrobium ahrensii TaxID=469551 RepID=A0ABV2KJC7_9HYPH
MQLIDLRSDTVTKPSSAMRAVMAQAPVGDDQYGDDPSTNALEERIAALLGKDDAIFVPSGTMTNQIALKVLTRPGDDVIVGTEPHIVWHEAGASAANAGVQFTVIGEGGLFTAAEITANLKPRDHFVFPPTTLIVVENTHNRGGGVIFPQSEIDAIAEVASQAGVAMYLDGARLFNVAVATGADLATLARPFELVSVALSKGLGCPMGSVLAGSSATIAAARRIRRMFGGALRQSGIMAAAGLYALDNNIDRLAEDHANAQLIAARIQGLPGVRFDPATVHTNIVIFRLEEGGDDAVSFVERASRQGLLLSAFAERTVRLATHLDADRADCERAVGIIADLCTGKA